MDIQLIQEILLKLKPFSDELGNESEDVWQHSLQELFELKGQACLEEIIRYLKPSASFQKVGQARWERFLARTMLSVKGLPVDIFTSMAVRYLEAGLHIAENSGASLADDKAEIDFFSRLYEAKQLNASYEDSIVKDKLEKIKVVFPQVAKIIEVGEENGVFCSGKKKIVFFVKSGLDSFLGDIISSLKSEYNVKKYIVTELKQIDEGMAWADICWFEWCDELIAYGSNHRLARQKKVICRLHRYEAFTNYPQNVKWENVNTLLVVTGHLKKLLAMQIPDIENRVKIRVLENGVNLARFPFENRKSGFNIAYVGCIHARKNPVMLLQIMSELVKFDPQYKLYIAGVFQDKLIELYFHYQIEVLRLQENIIFEGWQDNIAEWFNDKQYILSTSIHESFGYGIAEAMARGVKPIIHNFLFANEIWDRNFLFNTVEEAITLIREKKYYSFEYRSFIEDNYSFEKQLNNIRNLVEEGN